MSRFRNLRDLWSDEPWPGKVMVVVAVLAVVVLLVGAAVIWHDRDGIRHAQRVNEVQALAIAEATKATAETRYNVDLAVCRRGKESAHRALINTVTLRRLLDVILAPAPDPTLSPQARQVRAEFERAQDQLRRSQSELRRERDRNCLRSVRPPNGVEKRLDEVIEDRKPKPKVTVTGRIRTVTTTLTIPGPSTTRTVTGPERTTTQTVTSPTRTETRETTVTLPQRTQTIEVHVPGPTQTVTQQVPVVTPPTTVTVTVEVPPTPPTETTP